MQTPIVIKIGGKFFDVIQSDEQSVNAFFVYLVNLTKQQRQVVLVHGGGSQVTELLSKMGKTSKKIDGLRVTSDEDIDLVTGVLAGQLNKRLAAKCQSLGILSTGISLADGGLCQCKTVSDELGWVGEPTGGKSLLINALFTSCIMPVVATIGADEKGNLYNVNADHAALHIAKLLNAELMLLSDVPGVLDAEQNLIEHLDKTKISQLIAQSVITDGMAVKVKAAQSAADTLQRNVTIASWFSTEKGTKVSPENKL